MCLPTAFNISHQAVIPKQILCFHENTQKRPKAQYQGV